MSVLGIDLGGTNVRAGLVRHNRLSRVKSLAVRSQGTQDEVLDQIYHLIDGLIPNDLEGIGVGVPSVVDLERGIVYDVMNIPSWKKVPIKSLLEKRYHVPAYVNNDANCFAVGEKYFGRGKTHHHLVGLIVGTGLGAGVIANGKLYSGANCGAGEFGMISYREHNLEYYCSGQFFKNVHQTSGKELFLKAQNGEGRALKIFSEFGAHLGEAIKVILYAVDPEIIVLGGSVSRSFEFFRRAMWESTRDFAYPTILKNIKIEVSEREHIAILGAAALYYDAMK
jgi:glucokinase